MRIFFTLVLFIFFLSNCYSQKDLTKKYLDFTKTTDSIIRLDFTRFLKVDIQIGNANNKTIGYGTDHFHWISDTICLIVSTKDYKFKKTGYSIYFQSNKPVFFQINRRWIYKKRNKPKRIYSIDYDNQKIYRLDGAKPLKPESANWIFNMINSQYKYWIESVKNFNFEKLHTPNPQ